MAEEASAGKVLQETGEERRKQQKEEQGEERPTQNSRGERGSSDGRDAVRSQAPWLNIERYGLDGSGTCSAFGLDAQEKNLFSDSPNTIDAAMHRFSRDRELVD